MLKWGKEEWGDREGARPVKHSMWSKIRQCRQGSSWGTGLSVQRLQLVMTLHPVGKDEGTSK